MESSPPRSSATASVVGVKRPASLLPAFEPLSSSPSLPRPQKRMARDSHGIVSTYPTPVPTSSTHIMSSSPPRMALSRSASRRTIAQSGSERTPLSTVPTLMLPESGEPILMVHVKATYKPAPNPFDRDRVEIMCMGWNGVKLLCQGKTYELAKGKTFTSDIKDADIMVDVHDARVLVQWPRNERKDYASTDSEQTWDETTPKGPNQSRRSLQDSPLGERPRLASPVSPSPAVQSLVPPSSPLFTPSRSRNAVVVYVDEASPVRRNLSRDVSSPRAAQESVRLADVLQSSQSSDLSDFSRPDEFSDHDEENDPIIHSFGPFGDNLLPRMASFSADESPLRGPRTSRPLQPTHSPKQPKQPSEEDSSERKSGLTDETYERIQNHAANQLAFSRLSSTPFSTILNNLPPALWKRDDRSKQGPSSEEIRAILESTKCIGKVAREGKDAAGKPLESEYYYIPDFDDDDMRREAVVNDLRKPGLRNCRKQHKQYFWRELRDLNERAWAGESVSSSLDSSLKKNTAFIKRLRTGINASVLQTFLTDIRTLSLHKYLSEIISACYEGLCKLKSPGEIAAGVEVTSALHQRFGPDEFTRQIGWLLGRGLSTPDKSQLRTLSQELREREEKERLSRHRVLLRVVTELWLVGVLRTLDDIERPDDLGAKGKDGVVSIGGKATDAVSKPRTTPSAAKEQDKEAEPFPLEVLKDLLGHDREHANLPLAVLFAKSFSWDILGANMVDENRKTVDVDGTTTSVAPPETVSGGDDATAPENEPPLVSEKTQLRFKSILSRYLEDVKAHVVRDQRALAAQSRRNAEAYVKSGEIFEDRQANFDKQSKSLEKLVANTQVLCEVLGVEMPVLAEQEAADSASSGGIGLVKTSEYLRGQGEGPGIWEDEEERRFYENLVDLKGKVPPVLLEDGKKKKSDSDDAAKKRTDGEATPDSSVEKPENASQTPTSEEKSAAEAEDQSTAIASKTVGAQVDALLARLPELQTKDQVDQLALEFCFLNSKASRNRLIKAVSDVPKGRVDLLPLYSRLVATLGQYLQDIPQGLITYLDEEFRSLQRRKSKEFLGQVRMTNIRYFAELTKFGVVPEHIIFHCFKVSLDDFSRMNIEIIGHLLENCGRYLLRNPETSPRMASFLEKLGRKKAVQHLGQQERMIIENAMYYVDPPPRPAIQQKERTPMESYIRKLIYLDMNKRNYTKVLKSIRKLHWEEQDVVDIMERVFSKPVKVKYGNIHLLAILVSALYRYHQDFVISVVDNILEQITLGLEQNDFKFNQKRVAEVKYLGELYNYKMIDSPVVFDTLYRIVTFGYEGGTPIPGKLNPLDLPDDFFRIRLVCTLLDTCGHCFDRGSAKKKLDFFLIFFQYYYLTKDPLPMDVEFLIQDTFAMARPQWKLMTDLQEATRLFSEAVAQNYKTSDSERPVEPDEDDAESSSSDDGLEDDAIPEAEEEQESSDEAEVSGPNAEQDTDSESEDEQIFVTRQEEERDPEVEAEFDREFEKMMAESMESRRFERKAVFDIPLPMRRAGREASAGDGVTEAPPERTNTMAFSLMTKKGNKQQTRTIDLPSDSSFAIAMKSQQQADREEQQRIKNLVLNYEMNNEAENNTEVLEKRTSPKLDKPGSNRTAFRSRKLQLSDVNW
ncbi:hypothetical protein KXV68_006037 [Aspergillus fumigatus]|nr:hypothetical protein CNMCM8714_000112 [Aspergillus fumigatus]KAF4278605.1 hypothetical protein CNMCM8057_000285 [Aspergillus fumigatus]KAH1341327.1 hypothetical protein KXX67_007400 [Aspergillus fumigatus]KAH1462518.1 hypothetical protein KXX13_006257 [Aspergillus fumigatus]KAH1521256.1 hypothetical protein KXX29_003360 [Aspergillus fumigatus]